MKTGSPFPAVSRRAGFTLVELLIVVAVIAILAALLFPAFSRVRENARRVSCQSNLRQLGLGLTQYTQDFDERLPPCLTWDGATPAILASQLVYPYVKSRTVYACPSNESKNTNINNTADTADYPALPVSYAPASVENLSAAEIGGTAPFTLWSGAQVGTSLAQLGAPSETILYGENVSQWYAYARGLEMMELNAAHNGGANDFYQGFAEYWPLKNGHLKTMNWLFADGHVKAMRNLATATPVNMWTIEDDGDTMPAGTKLHLENYDHIIR